MGRAVHGSKGLHPVVTATADVELRRITRGPGGVPANRSKPFVDLAVDAYLQLP